MKRLLVAVFLLAGFCGRSQTIPQLTEQLALDVAKLGQMKAILKDMYTAYTVIDKGYSNVKGIVAGNYNLHKTFLDALLVVAPSVRNYSRVADIVRAETSIVAEAAAGYNKCKAAGRFSVSELGYLSGLYDQLLTRSLDGLDGLLLVMTDGQLRMNDSQRLGMIDRIWTERAGDLALLRELNNGTAVQTVQRAKEAADIGVLKGLWGIE